MEGIMKKQARILSFVLVLAMLCCLYVPAAAYAEESEYVYLSSQEMYDWLTSRQDKAKAIRPETLEEAERCLDEFHPCDWVREESKESVFEQIVAQTEELVKGKTSDTEKAYAIYHWISQNISYDYLAAAYCENPALHGVYEDAEKYLRMKASQDAFYAFSDRSSICGGYATLSKLMLTIAGIPAAHIAGTARYGGNHAWNAAYADGRWILFDTTWDKWDMAPNYHGFTGTIAYSEGVFSCNLMADGVVWYWIFPGSPCPAHVEIPEGVVELNGETFLNCTGMESVTIPEGVAQIGYSAFEGCTNLKSVTIPASVKEIKRDAFKGCTSLTDITFLGDVPKIGENAFKDVPWFSGQGDFVIANGTLMQYRGNENEVKVPDGVTKIGEYAFVKNLSLTRVVLPESVTEIGARAFRWCYYLNDIVIPKSVTTFGASAFVSTPWLERQGDLVVLNGCLVTYEGKDEVENLVVPDGVKEISEQSLYYCKGMSSITIPASVAKIGAEAVCYSIPKDIYYAGTKEQWEAIAIEIPNWWIDNATIHYNSTSAR